ncbi:MAG TPA: PAS domain S-box protein, partial [Rubrobacteraceae bacterium]|nr:PAS domain S-box protein [Rubrobacteraceae bacterium]
MVGARLGDLLPSSISENVEYLKAFVRCGYQLTDAESQEVDRHGEVKYFSNNLTGIVENESLLRVWGTQRDISERKRWEEALQISETRFRTMIEQSPLSVQILSPDGWTLQVNRAWKELWGVTLDDLVGYNLLEDQQLVAKGVMPYVQRGFAGEPTAISPIMYDPDETIPSLSSHEEPKRWVRAFIYPVLDEAGNVREVVLIHEDVTERKRAEEELRESEERFRGTFEQAAVGMAHVGTDGRWLRVNQRLCDIVGYEKEELLGLTFSDTTHPDDRETDLEGARRLLDGEIETYSREKRYFKKDGSIVWIYLTVSLVRTPSGEPRYFISVTEDITERKRIEEAQRFLAEAGTPLSSSLDYRTTLARVARLAVPYLADWCVVDILNEEDGSLERLAVAHQDPEKVALVHELQEHYAPDPDAPRGVGQVLRTGRPELIPEIPDSLLEEAARDVEHRELLRGLGLKSYMIVPLVARGRTLGAISLVSAESGRRYGQAELELTEELAWRAALAVDNARLYRARSEVARTLQEGLLPSCLPEVPGVEVGLRYLSAGEVDVGGDFYDLFDARVRGEAAPSAPSPSWSVVIGDVSGKGAEAAAVLALARYTIRALAMRETRPSAILAGLNQIMLRQRRERDDHKFCTVACVRLEMDEGDEGRGARISAVVVTRRPSCSGPTEASTR